MKLSNRGLDLIIGFEGLRLSAYTDFGGVWTIGYGHTSGVRPGQRITASRARALLRDDVATFERAVDRAVKVPLTQGQFDALVSFSYNCGEGALRSSTLLRKLNAGDYSGARREFARWVKDNGVTLSGLVRRRAAEADLFGEQHAADLGTRDIHRTLEIGDAGLDVAVLQRAVNRRLKTAHLSHYTVDDDGELGRLTLKAIYKAAWGIGISRRRLATIDKKHVVQPYVQRRLRDPARRTPAEVALAEQRIATHVAPKPAEPPPPTTNAGKYPKGLPEKYRKYWDRPWSAFAARNKGFREWLDNAGLLTPHFTKAEAACKDGTTVDQGGVNRAARDHAFSMEKLRHALGDVPIPTLSWFRTWAWNRHVGGASNSQHPRGTASDHASEWIASVGRQKVQRLAEAIWRNGGVGTYPAGSMHFDDRGVRARWSSF